MLGKDGHRAALAIEMREGMGSMVDFTEPIQDMRSRQTNAVLHGRSVFCATDIPEDNVFRGNIAWANNGNIGIGDAVDLFGEEREPVYAIADSIQTVWRNDETRTEVIYLEAAGWLAVYANIDARHKKNNVRVRKGEVIGHLSNGQNGAHLHFELWIDGVAVSARSGALLRDTMLVRLGIVPSPSVPERTVSKRMGLSLLREGFICREVLAY